MKRGSIVFLKMVLVLMAAIVLVGMIHFPLTEGRATHLDIISIYTDPLIIYTYIASIPFYVALYQAFTLLGYMEKNNIFSSAAVKAMKHIKFCALTIIGFLAVAILCIRMFIHGDDSAGPTMLGFIAIFTSIVIATAAAIFQKLLQNVVDMKAENDLTI